MNSATVSVGVTIAAFLVGRVFATWMAKRNLPPLVHPVAVSLIAAAIYLRLSGTTYADYLEHARPLTFLLGPAIVALAVPLYDQGTLLRKRGAVFAMFSLACAIIGTISGYVTARCLSFDADGQFALMARCATSPMAIAAADAVHRSIGLAGATAVFCGLIGGVIGPWLMDVLHIRHPLARGITLGAVATGVGTARALEEGEETGSAAATAMILTGIAVSVLVPLIVRLISSPQL